MKKVQIIAKQQTYLNTITRQLEVIFADKCELSSGTLQEVTQDMLKNQDVIVLSKEMFIGIIRPFIPPDCPIIIVHREINILGTRKILHLPKGQRILVISDLKEHVEETIQSLKDIYFEHKYKSYDPEQAFPENFDWIVTPGEQELVPRGFKNVIDIGPRGISFQSVLEIAQFLNVDFDEKNLMNRFLKSHLVLPGPTTDVDSKETLTIEKNGQKTNETNEKSLRTDTIFNDAIAKIEEHGFLEESIAVLEVYNKAKKDLKSIGRTKVRKKLIEKNLHLSEQQLRLRLEVMQEIGLVIARQGRGGTKISDKGELFLKEVSERIN